MLIIDVLSCGFISQSHHDADTGGTHMTLCPVWRGRGTATYCDHHNQERGYTSLRMKGRIFGFAVDRGRGLYKILKERER